MLPIAVIVLVFGTVWTIVKAPAVLRAQAAAFLLVPSAIGGGLAFALTANPTYKLWYAIAGAIGGWVVGTTIFDSRRRKWLAANPAEPVDRAA